MTNLLIPESTMFNIASLIAICVGEPQDTLSSTLSYLEYKLKEMPITKDLIEHCLSVVEGQLIAKGLT